MYINKYVNYRFESKIMGGKTFIFNILNYKILVSSKLVYDILLYIDTEHPTINEILLKFNEQDVNSIINKLLEEEIIHE